MYIYGDANRFDYYYYYYYYYYIIITNIIIIITIINWQPDENAKILNSL